MKEKLKAIFAASLTHQNRSVVHTPIQPFESLGSRSISLMVGSMLLVGCIDSWEGPPHFLHVESFEIETTSEQGTSSSRIEEVWVYSETDVLGAFPLPADIPLSPDVLGSTCELTLSAGIRANAIAATRKPYPFYEALRHTMNLEFGGRDTLAIVRGYTDLTEVIIAEDFELANRFQESNTSTAQVVRTENPEWVIEGLGSGLIELTAENSTLISMTNEQNFDLTTNGPVWLELNYACTQPFLIGLNISNASSSQRTPILMLNSTSGDRNKIYLDLGPVVRTTPDATDYEITLDASFDGSADTTRVIVDNFKLLRYP